MPISFYQRPICPTMNKLRRRIPREYLHLNLTIWPLTTAEKSSIWKPHCQEWDPSRRPQECWRRHIVMPLRTTLVVAVQHRMMIRCSMLSCPLSSLFHRTTSLTSTSLCIPTIHSLLAQYSSLCALWETSVVCTTTFTRFMPMRHRGPFEGITYSYGHFQVQRNFMKLTSSLLHLEY